MASAFLNDEQKFNDFVQTSFAEADTDKNGQIDANELQVILAKLASQFGSSAPSKEEVVKTLEKFDTNNDGTISVDEFSPLLRDFLSAM
jgi:Ca2+-binding EF-hand superfamily protein